MHLCGIGLSLLVQSQTIAYNGCHIMENTFLVFSKIRLVILVILPTECLVNHNICYLHIETLKVSNKTPCV